MIKPIQKNERIELLDAIRGFALLGILMVNMPIMYEPISKIMLDSPADQPWHEFIAESFIKFFFEGKFFLTFSMLFGYGFYIFLQKSDNPTVPVLSVYQRRLFLLLLFGMAHILLLWGGDVLFIYALFGFLLLLFRKSKDKKIIGWAIFFALFPIVIMGLLVIVLQVLSLVPEIGSEIEKYKSESNAYYQEMVSRAIGIYSGGTFSEIVSMRLEEYADSAFTSLIFFCPNIMSMFLIGYLAARRGIFSDLQQKAVFFRKILLWALPIGLVANSIFLISFHISSISSPDIWLLLSSTMGLIGGFSFSLSYISIISLSYIAGKKLIIKNIFVPMGRMALSNYLMQSTICAFIFHSYGLGYYGKVEVWQGILLTFFIYSVQVIFSNIWLRFFQYGPLEWIWRSLTYLKFQEMRK